MTRHDNKRKKRIWQAILVVSLVLEIVLISMSVVSHIRGASFPLWQMLFFVGIAVWIYIAFLKQRSIDISRTVVEEKIKTHTLADYLREGILIVDQEGQILLVNRRAAAVLGVDELDVLGETLADLVDDAGRKLLEGEQSGEVITTFNASGRSVHFSVVAMDSNRDGERNTIVYVREAETQDGSEEQTERDTSDEGAVCVALNEISAQITKAGKGNAELIRAGVACRLLEAELALRGRAGTGNAVPFKAGDVAKGIVDELRASSEELSVLFEEGYNDVEISFAGDADMIRRAMLQVIGNALLSAPEKTTVKVQTAVMGNHSGMAVTDARDMADIDDVSVLFDSGSFSAQRVGYGAARHVVEACGGTLTADKGAEGGLRITLMLPAAS